MVGERQKTLTDFAERVKKTGELLMGLLFDGCAESLQAMCHNK